MFGSIRTNSTASNANDYHWTHLQHQTLLIHHWNPHLLHQAVEDVVTSLDVGISNNNVIQATSGTSDDDFSETQWY